MSVKCPAPECGRTITAAYFLCWRHWRELSLAQRINVSAAFRVYTRARDRGSLEEQEEATAHLRTVQATALATLHPVTAEKPA